MTKVITVSGGLFVMFAALTTLEVYRAGLRSPRIRLEAEDIDLGYLPDGASTETTVRVFNDGSATLSVTDVRTSCSCTEISLANSTIEPGGSSQLAVGIKGSHHPTSSARISIVTNDKQRPVADITIKMRSRKGIWCHTNSLSFGHLDKLQIASAQSRELVIEGEQKLEADALRLVTDERFDRAFSLLGKESVEGKVIFRIKVRDDCPCGFVVSRLRLIDEHGNDAAVKIEALIAYPDVIDFVTPGLMRVVDGVRVGQSSVVFANGVQVVHHEATIDAPGIVVSNVSKRGSQKNEFVFHCESSQVRDVSYCTIESHFEVDKVGNLTVWLPLTVR